VVAPRSEGQSLLQSHDLVTDSSVTSLLHFLTLFRCPAKLKRNLKQPTLPPALNLSHCESLRIPHDCSPVASLLTNHVQNSHPSTWYSRARFLIQRFLSNPHLTTRIMNCKRNHTPTPHHTTRTSSFRSSSPAKPPVSTTHPTSGNVLKRRFITDCPISE